MTNRQIDRRLSRVNAFTLAEVLVVITIIGIVASLAIPNLINRYQRQIWISSYLTNYGVVEQSTRMLMENNGGTMLNAWGIANDNKGMYDAYTPYLNVVKKCEDTNPMGKCLAAYYEDLIGDPIIISGSHYYSVILANGASLMFWASGGAQALGNTNYIYMDINGVKAPNVWGKDYHILAVYIQPDALKPQNYNVGAGNVILYCPNDLKTTTATNVGRTCGLRILRGDYANSY